MPTLVARRLASFAATDKAAKELLDSAAKGDKDATFELGKMLCFHEANVDLGIGLIRKAAKEGNAAAALHLGDILYEGKFGEDVDMDQAMLYYRISAASGSSEGQYKLANMYEAGKGCEADQEEALVLYKLSMSQRARGDNPTAWQLAALVKVGDMLESGRGAPANLAEARKLYCTAARCGEVGIYVPLACMYVAGRGGPVNHTKARRLFELVIEAGLGSLFADLEPDDDGSYQAALCNLATLLRLGLGGRADLNRARCLFALSADLGNKTARAHLGDMFWSGEGGAVDKEAARRMFELAVCQGETSALGRLAKMIHRGEGGWGDPASAIQLYAAAADAGCQVSRLILADMYRMGEGCNVDMVEAGRLYQVGAKAGDPASMFELAGMYERGEVGPFADLREARKWYEEALRLGYGLAEERIARIANRIAESLLEDKEEGASSKKSAKRSAKNRRRKAKQKTRFGSEEFREVQEEKDGRQEEPRELREPEGQEELEPSATSVGLVSAVSVDVVSSEGDDTTCIVCMTFERSRLAVPCGHETVCETCSSKLDTCPYCRQPAILWVRRRCV